MRNLLILLATTSLSACSGGGPTTVGGNAVGSGGSVGGTTSTHTFVNPTEVKVYQAIGGLHHYEYATDDRGSNRQYGQFYAGDSSTARNSGISVTYNPRDGIFDLALADPKASVSQNLRFQDPLHRTAFGGLREPQSGVPDLPVTGIQYLQAGSGTGTPDTDGYMSNVVTYFYQKPGTTTQFVTYGGFVRNAVSEVKMSVTGTTTTYLQYDWTRERGAFVFGERTGNSAVPKIGTGTFNGEMIASLVYNPLRDTTADSPTYFQWLSGTARTSFDFVANTFTIALAGTVGAPALDQFSSGTHDLTTGSTFAAMGAGTIDLINAGGFLGSFSSAAFTKPGQSAVNLTLAGSSVDGAFYGPVGQEVGGGFRIVGGTPDQRIDIHGAFVGK